MASDIDMLKAQIDDLTNKVGKLETDNNMLKTEKNQLIAQNCALETRLKQLEALVRTIIENIEE